MNTVKCLKMSEFFNEPQFKKFEIPVHTDEWFDFRTIGIDGYEGGIGASEAAKTLTGNKYRDKYRPSLPELFQQKIGMWPVQRFDNVRMVMGRIEEPRVAEYWKHWNGDVLETYQAFERGDDIERDCVVLPFYLVNEKYPWLFASWDRGILPGQRDDEGTILEKISPLEIKTIGSYAAQQYVNRIPPKYIVQLHQQMIIGESEYGEVFVKEDDGTLAMHAYHRSDELVNLILDKTKSFWDRVVKARPMFTDWQIADTAGKTDLADRIMGEIMALEPDVDGSDAHKEFLIERYQDHLKPEIIRGDVACFSDSVQTLKIRAVIKDLKERQDLLDNKVRDAICKSGSEELHFDDDSGKVMLKKGRLYVKPKIDINEDEVEALVDEIIQTSKLF